MTAFQRTIICFAIFIGIFAFFKPWRTPDMTIVYPDNCAFVIDAFFSRTMQLEIKDFIDAAYKKSKSPANLLPKIESHFPAIKSVIIDMSSLTQENKKVLNFTIQAYHPIFLLNDEHVICEGSRIFGKAIFASAELSKLENIAFEGVPTPKNIHRLMTFFESLSGESAKGSSSILKDFSIRWVDKHAIWLDQKAAVKLDQEQGQDFSLLVGYNTMPNQHDVMQCRNLRGQIVDKPCKDKRGRLCKNNTTWVCDLRFDQQIVLFSTNKGV
ncbi:MAG: hypothetical protein Q8Q60_00660 [Candidatus Chromulinivorax sp.]|nr:hypothetical protein [Candidatus Chromulinivorax sp.]